RDGVAVLVEVVLLVRPLDPAGLVALGVPELVELRLRERGGGAGEVPPRVGLYRDDARHRDARQRDGHQRDPDQHLDERETLAPPPHSSSTSPVSPTRTWRVSPLRSSVTTTGAATVPRGRNVATPVAAIVTGTGTSPRMSCLLSWVSR